MCTDTSPVLLSIPSYCDTLLISCLCDISVPLLMHTVEIWR